MVGDEGCRRPSSKKRGLQGGQACRDGGARARLSRWKNWGRVLLLLARLGGLVR